MPHGPILITAPAAELVTTAEVKTHLRVDHSNDDTIIALLAIAARVACEEYTGMCLINTTWELVFDEAEMHSPDPLLTIEDLTGADTRLGDAIDLPRAPLSSITSIKSYNDSNTESTFSSANYYADTTSYPGRVALVSGQVWPQDLRAIKSMVIRYVSGFGASAANVPLGVSEAFEAAIKLTVADLYQNRGDAEMANKKYSLPPTAKMILRPFRVRWG